MIEKQEAIGDEVSEKVESQLDFKVSSNGDSRKKNKSCYMSTCLVDC